MLPYTDDRLDDIILRARGTLQASKVDLFSRGGERQGVRGGGREGAKDTLKLILFREKEREGEREGSARGGEWYGRGIGKGWKGLKPQVHRFIPHLFITPKLNLHLISFIPRASSAV